MSFVPNRQDIPTHDGLSSSGRQLNIIMNMYYRNMGSGALLGKISLVRIIENYIIDAYFRSG